MDFVRYAEQAAQLINHPLDSLEDLTELLADREQQVAEIADRDRRVLQRFQRELRPAFDAAATGAEVSVVDTLNALFGKHPVTPYVSGHGGSWDLHISDRTPSVTDQLMAQALMGLAVVVCDAGARRLGVCDANGCDDVFVDTSPNHSRRYCSERCSSRANVAAYRARRRAEAAQGATA